MSVKDSDAGDEGKRVRNSEDEGGKGGKGGWPWREEEKEKR